MAWAPNPPNFYRQFTQTNLSRLEDIKKEQSSKGGILDLPPELRYLIPPNPPATGDYRLFGVPRTTRDYLASLPDQNIVQLYPPSDVTDASKDWTLDRGAHLKDLSRSLMLSFVELMGILSVNPAEGKRKLDEMKLLMLNALHLINEYRPHQARESLILRIEEAIEKGKAEVDSVKRLRAKVDSLLANSADDMDVIGNGNAVDGPADRTGDHYDHEAQQLNLWRALATN